MWEAACICAGYVPVRLRAPGKHLTDGSSARAEHRFFFLSVEPLSWMESVLVSVLIKGDSFSFLDSLPGISRVCLSNPCDLFLFDLGEPREIRTVTFSAASSAFFLFVCFVSQITEQCIKNHYIPHRISAFSVCRMGLVLRRGQ